MTIEQEQLIGELQPGSIPDPKPPPADAEPEKKADPLGEAIARALRDRL